VTISDLDNALLLVQRVGDVDPLTADPVWPFTPGKNGIVMLNAERLYNKYVNRKALQPAALGSEIFDHLFMIAATQLIIGVVANRVTFSAVGTSVRLQLTDRIKAYQANLLDFRQSLAELYKQLGAWTQPAIGLITRIEPITPPLPGQLSSPLASIPGAPFNPFILDANDPTLTGSPYLSIWRRW
jgi:hypothetical protein